MGEQEFHGNRSAERLIEGPPDLSHRAPPDGVSQPVSARYQHVFFILMPKDVLIAASHDSPWGADQGAGCRSGPSVPALQPCLSGQRRARLLRVAPPEDEDACMVSG
ncbi:hypothetical protein GCM10010211_35600 [Streptomyces albospinus]|uniref:Uncharacterized protein n=1 Tax=Streptomyces albospinus TaxID=285515 RepID=A0ABQ2V3F4_9ACTN|nr:hypothetical protein GCM10010211_35600 [Streptomyces albospinus]